MPARKTTSKKVKKTALKIKKDLSTQRTTYKQLFYGALTLIFLIVAIFVGYKVFNHPRSMTKDIAGEGIKTSAKEETIIKESKYTVLEGDSLWSIAEKFYKSGYNWTDIAKANNLSNPGMIEAGEKLTIPDVKPILISSEIKNTNVNVVSNTNRIDTKEYTVQKGDSLWDIAVRAYGDGYKWVVIAKINNLSNNPDLIFSGNVLKLPGK